MRCLHGKYIGNLALFENCQACNGVSKMENKRDAFTELESTKCFCGKRKGSGKSFCWNCWRILPRSLQNRLYEPWEYAKTVDEAHKFLAARKVVPGRLVL